MPVIRRLQDYQGHHWNEIGRVNGIVNKLVYHFARNQDDPLPQPWQVRDIDSEQIIKEWRAPHPASGWDSVKGKGMVLFAGQFDIKDWPRRPSGSPAHYQPTFVVKYDGENFSYVQLPNTDAVNEFYSLCFNPIGGHFYGGEVDRNNPNDWSLYPNAGGVWRSPDGRNWTRIWEDPHPAHPGYGRLIHIRYLNGHVYAICDKSTLDGVFPGETLLNSVYRITPSITHLFDYDKNVTPLHKLEPYIWKGRLWASGLVSFDGSKINFWTGSLPDGHVYPIGVDHEGSLLLRLCHRDYSTGGYTIGKVREINGPFEYVADEWKTHRHVVHTVGGYVAPNNKLFIGLWDWPKGSPIGTYACLDVISLNGGVPPPKYKLKFIVREAT